MAQYPSTLPGPQLAEYAVDIRSIYASTRFEHGNTRQRRFRRTNVLTFNFSFTFTTDQLWIWQSWANVYGYDWHTMNLKSAYSGLSTVVGTLVPHTVRYISDITLEHIAIGLVRASVVAEMDVNTLPVGVVTYTGNWYVGGTPASPSSANAIRAETPASPSSSNTITAGSPANPAA